MPHGKISILLSLPSGVFPGSELNPTAISTPRRSAVYNACPQVAPLNHAPDPLTIGKTPSRLSSLRLRLDALDPVQTRASSKSPFETWCQSYQATTFLRLHRVRRPPRTFQNPERVYPKMLKRTCVPEIGTKFIPRLFCHGQTLVAFSKTPRSYAGVGASTAVDATDLEESDSSDTTASLNTGSWKIGWASGFTRFLGIDLLIFRGIMS